MATDRPSFPEVMQQVLGASKDQMRVCLPGTVISTKGGGKADIQVTVTGERDGLPMVEPKLLDVPVLGMGNYRATVQAPILPGDPVLLIFADRDISRWKNAKGIAPTVAETKRTHDLTDCVAIPIMWGSAAVDLWSFIASMLTTITTGVMITSGSPPVWIWNPATNAALVALQARLTAAGVKPG